MAALAASMLSAPVLAEPLQVGMPLPALSLADQHDKPGPVGPDVRLLVITRDMDGGNIVKEALAQGGAATLAKADAVCISDISRMPGFVTSMFALPALKKRDYPVLLDRDGKATADFPYEENHVALVSTDGTKVTAVRFVATAKDLEAALASP
jgi:hypothetical protein